MLMVITRWRRGKWSPEVKILKGTNRVAHPLLEVIGILPNSRSVVRYPVEYSHTLTIPSKKMSTVSGCIYTLLPLRIGARLGGQLSTSTP
jgi:hypothetical protein